MKDLRKGEEDGFLLSLAKLTENSFVNFSYVTGFPFQVIYQ